MEYWNHNTAYHPWILRHAQLGRVLDVGCGDGLLLARLAAAGCSGVGLEPDIHTADRARARLANYPHLTVCAETFADYQLPDDRFDLVTMVASLHHMPLADALGKARQALRPNGTLLVVGLSAKRSLGDWVVSGMKFPVAWCGSKLHQEKRDIGVPVMHPSQTLREIRTTARKLLPGVKIRHGIYYRYLLCWKNV